MIVPASYGTVNISWTTYLPPENIEVMVGGGPDTKSKIVFFLDNITESYIQMAFGPRYQLALNELGPEDIDYRSKQFNVIFREDGIFLDDIGTFYGVLPGDVGYVKGIDIYTQTDGINLDITNPNPYYPPPISRSRTTTITIKKKRSYEGIKIFILVLLMLIAGLLGGLLITTLW